jgi:hypothetical protein
VITFANGSIDRLSFDRWSQCRDVCQHGISYSGGRVRRVEVDCAALGGGLRAMWDVSWTAESQHAGLYN